MLSLSLNCPISVWLAQLRLAQHLSTFIHCLTFFFLFCRLLFNNFIGRPLSRLREIEKKKRIFRINVFFYSWKWYKQSFFILAIVVVCRRQKKKPIRSCENTAQPKLPIGNSNRKGTSNRAEIHHTPMKKKKKPKKKKKIMFKFRILVAFFSLFLLLLLLMVSFRSLLPLNAHTTRVQKGEKGYTHYRRLFSSFFFLKKCMQEQHRIKNYMCDEWESASERILKAPKKIKENRVYI